MNDCCHILGGEFNTKREVIFPSLLVRQGKVEKREKMMLLRGKTY
jgi:hypothetical protein